MGAPAGHSDSPPPYGTLVFDCDSTLSAIEGIDELAGARRAETARLTQRAMAGELALEAVYAQRLELLAPTRAAIRAVGAQYTAQALPHSRELIAALRALGKRTCIVSGGISAAVLALAAHLGVPADEVFAVEVFHDAEGNYAGFDERSPLARTGGKLGVIQQLAREDPTGSVALVGDGITDWEASPAARRFVAFGGVVRRAEVFERAQVRCERRDLAALLPLLCTGAEIEALASESRHESLIRAARS
jgi:phosphoserine phosphatase